MKLLPLIIGILGLFIHTTILAQSPNNSKPSKVTSLKEQGYPKFIDTGNLEKDTYTFQKAVYNYAVRYREFPNLSQKAYPVGVLEKWNINNPDIAEDLNFFDYEAYLSFIVEDYPSIPQKVSTGNTKADKLTNKQNLKSWTEQHPCYPKYSENTERLRQTRLAFYDRYIKPYLNL